VLTLKESEPFVNLSTAKMRSGFYCC